MWLTKVAIPCSRPAITNHQKNWILGHNSAGGGLTRLVGSFFGVSVGHEQCGWTVHYRVDVCPFLGTTVGCRVHAAAVNLALIVAEFKLVP